MSTTYDIITINYEKRKPTKRKAILERDIAMLYEGV